MIKDNQQITILRFFPNLFFLSFQVFQVWHLGKAFDKLGSVPTCRCQKKRKVMGHVKHPPQKDSPIFFPKWHPSNGTSRRMVPPVEEFDLPKPRWTKLTKEMASLFFHGFLYKVVFAARKTTKTSWKGLNSGTCWCWGCDSQNLRFGSTNVFLGPLRENGVGENDLEKKQFMGFKQIRLKIFPSSSLPRSNWSPLCWG